MAAGQIALRTVRTVRCVEKAKSVVRTIEIEHCLSRLGGEPAESRCPALAGPIKGGAGAKFRGPRQEDGSGPTDRRLHVLQDVLDHFLELEARVRLRDVPLRALDGGGHIRSNQLVVAARLHARPALG